MTPELTAEEKAYIDIDFILMTLTKDQIYNLGREASEHGDEETVSICYDAMGGEWESKVVVAALIRAARIAELGDLDIK